MGWNLCEMKKKLVNLSFERQFLKTACHKKKDILAPPPTPPPTPLPKKWKSSAHWTYIYTVQFYSKMGVLQQTLTLFYVPNDHLSNYCRAKCLWCAKKELIQESSSTFWSCTKLQLLKVFVVQGEEDYCSIHNRLILDSNFPQIILATKRMYKSIKYDQIIHIFHLQNHA